MELVFRVFGPCALDATKHVLNLAKLSRKSPHYGTLTPRKRVVERSLNPAHLRECAFVCGAALLHRRQSHRRLSAKFRAIAEDDHEILRLEFAVYDARSWLTVRRRTREIDHEPAFVCVAEDWSSELDHTAATGASGFEPPVRFGSLFHRICGCNSKCDESPLRLCPQLVEQVRAVVIVAHHRAVEG